MCPIILGYYMYLNLSYAIYLYLVSSKNKAIRSGEYQQEIPRLQPKIILNWVEFCLWTMRPNWRFSSQPLSRAILIRLLRMIGSLIILSPFCISDTLFLPPMTSHANYPVKLWQLYRYLTFSALCYFFQKFGGSILGSLCIMQAPLLP